jgi:hypothetical protein
MAENVEKTGEENVVAQTKAIRLLTGHIFIGESHLDALENARKLLNVTADDAIVYEIGHIELDLRFVQDHNQDEIRKEKYADEKKIIASAVRVMYDGLYSPIFLGKRHSDALKKLRFYFPNEIVITEEGFVTTDLEFLNRKEALIFAKEHGQFKREELWFKAHPNEKEFIGYNGGELYSEDLW